MVCKCFRTNNWSPVSSPKVRDDDITARIHNMDTRVEDVSERLSRLEYERVSLV